MVRAIIFDCFGVLTHDGWLPFKRKYFGEDPAREQQATDLGRQVNAGLLDYNAFMRQLAALAAIPIEQVRASIHDNVPNEELFAYMEQDLKPHYKLGLLSNTGRDMLGEIFSEQQLDLFDAAALSYETGHLKPARQAYETIAARLDVAPGECIFIDDQERYCTAAIDVGMQAICYRDFDQFKAELEPMLAA